jgi:hypothetical protein
MITVGVNAWKPTEVVEATEIVDAPES